MHRENVNALVRFRAVDDPTLVVRATLKWNPLPATITSDIHVRQNGDKKNIILTGKAREDEHEVVVRTSEACDVLHWRHSSGKLGIRNFGIGSSTYGITYF